jgi:class 3 adenylate cyclase
VYCDRHPDDVAAMVSLEPSPPFRWPRDIVQKQIAGEMDSVALFCPSRANEPGFREWFTRAGRIGASPTRAAHAYPTWTDAEASDIARATARITAPTLVLRRPASQFSPPAASDPVVALVPGALRVDLPGEDLMFYGNEVDALLAEITKFVTGEHRVPAPECALAAVLFSDVVASTEQAATLGGERWKRLLDRHDELARTCVGRRGGTVIKTTGDGILATLPSGISAIRAAQELQSTLAAEGLKIRIGVHVGDIDLRNDDISGLAVNIAARIMHLAAPGELLVSRTVTDLIVGSTIPIADRGEHELKGVPGTWRLFCITAA